MEGISEDARWAEEVGIGATGKMEYTEGVNEEAVGAGSAAVTIE